MVLGRVEIENSIWPEDIGLVGWMVLGRVAIENSIWPEEIGLVGWMVLGRVWMVNQICLGGGEGIGGFANLGEMRD